VNRIVARNANNFVFIQSLLRIGFTAWIFIMIGNKSLVLIACLGILWVSPSFGQEAEPFELQGTVQVEFMGKAFAYSLQGQLQTEYVGFGVGISKIEEITLLPLFLSFYNGRGWSPVLDPGVTAVFSSGSSKSYLGYYVGLGVQYMGKPPGFFMKVIGYAAFLPGLDFEDDGASDSITALPWGGLTLGFTF
jgi:hypothetical protein